MLAKRVIPCMDVKDGRVVKGVNFVNLRDAGDPIELAQRYDEQRADELWRKVEADIDFVMKKLNNPKFVDKAPEKVVAAEREKAEKLREHLAKLEESIAALN